MASASELASTQAELQSVKRALQSGAAYLGLQGEALQKYLLQLSEKENLLLSKQLHSMAAQDSFEPLLPATASSGPTRGYAAGHVTNGAHQPARPAPVGDAKAFNRENLQDVLTHMAEYEAVPAECAKALKALSSLAYSNARSVGKDERVLAALLRAVRLHQSEGAVQLTAMRAISNMAYDQEVALTRLAKSDVMGQLLTSVASKSEPKEIAATASEALARIYAAEEAKGKIALANCDKILDNLYLGGVEATSDPQQLTSQGVRAICVCCREFEIPSKKFVPGIEYYRVDVEDQSREPLEEFFEEATDFIYQWTSQNMPVLVHCRAGVSRSASVVLAYMIRYANYTLHDAFIYLRAARPVVTPNLGFMDKLVAYEEEIHGTDPTIDTRKYESWFTSQASSPVAIPDLLPE